MKFYGIIIILLLFSCGANQNTKKSNINKAIKFEIEGNPSTLKSHQKYFIKISVDNYSPKEISLTATNSVLVYYGEDKEFNYSISPFHTGSLFVSVYSKKEKPSKLIGKIELKVE